MTPESFDDILHPGSAPFESSLVRRYLEQSPAVVDALRARGYSVLAFTLRLAAEDDRDQFATAVQTEIERAERASHDARLLFVASGSLPELIAGGVYTLDRSSPVAPAAPVCERGAFAGTIAIGEGGLIFFDASGRAHHGSSIPDDVVLAAFR